MTPDMQNDMIKVMALQVLRRFARNMHSSPFITVIADETTDESNCEQVLICIHWVGDDLERYMKIP